MKRLLLLLALALPLTAAEPPLRDLLRDALYTEEVDRDPAKAAAHYEELLKRFDEQRPLAAAALFRLAEIRRGQDRKDEAVAFYQRLLREFPDSGKQAELAREHLAQLGGEMPAPGNAPDPEEAELARLREAVKNAPDVLTVPSTLKNAVAQGWPKVVAFLLDHGARPDGEIFADAARTGRLDLCRLLFQAKPLPQDAFQQAASMAIYKRRLEVLRLLLELGLDPNADFQGSIPVHDVVREGWAEGLDLLAKAGVDLDRPTSGPDGITPLHDAARRGSLDMVTQLLKLGAQPDPATEPSGTRPLHFALLADEADRLAIVKCLLAVCRT
jgi:tetratricopeptide (TPR) repeat protein